MIGKCRRNVTLNVAKLTKVPAPAVPTLKPSPAPWATSVCSPCGKPNRASGSRRPNGAIGWPFYEHLPEQIPGQDWPTMVVSGTMLPGHAAGEPFADPQHTL